jgi:hypothetical protein
MATPRPSTPLVLPAYTEDRGTILFDPTTKSTEQKASAFCKKDACGQTAYKVLSDSLSINQLLNADGSGPGCNIVLAASGSISLLVPRNATPADIDLIINELVTKIKVAAAAKDCDVA